jgi:hypothetical protein
MSIEQMSTVKFSTFQILVYSWLAWFSDAKWTLKLKVCQEQMFFKQMHVGHLLV